MDQLRSGLGGEVGEMDEILQGMRAARDDLDARKGARRAAEKRLESEKEIASSIIVSSLSKRGQSEELISNGDELSENYSKRKCTSAGKERWLVEGTLKSLGKKMRDVEMATISLERERMDLDFKLMEEDRTTRQKDRNDRALEREKDRIEHREDRGTMQRLELEKFKLMM